MQRPLPVTITALFTLLFLQSVSNAQALRYSLPERSHEDPAVNVYLSARYDYLLQTNSRFRHYRIWKECYPVNWPGLHEDCIVSFDQYEPVIAALYR